MGPQVVEALRSRFAGVHARRAPHGRGARAPRRRPSPRRARTSSPSTTRRPRTSTTRVAAIRDAGCRAGIAVCPSTPPAVFGEVDAATSRSCMTVNPGWGGQRFIAAQARQDPARARARGRRRRGRGRRRHRRRHRAGRCAEAGATLFVAGSAVFGADDPARAPIAEICGSRAGAASRTRGSRDHGPTMARVTTTVLIVDDHPSFRATARMLLEAEGYDVVGEAPDGESAVTEVGAPAPGARPAGRQPAGHRRLRGRRAHPRRTPA